MNVSADERSAGRWTKGLVMRKGGHSARGLVVVGEFEKSDSAHKYSGTSFILCNLLLFFPFQPFLPYSGPLNYLCYNVTVYPVVELKSFGEGRRCLLTNQTRLPVQNFH
jgi:hypothetical protein